MISVIALKSDHTLYNILRNVLKNINLDFNIIGLDDPFVGNDNSFYFNPDFYNKPFFLYLEEPRCFKNNFILNHINFKGFISHLKITCEEMRSNFNVPVYYLELSSEEKNYVRINQSINSLRNNRPINFISWGSWTDFNDSNFSNRGGNSSDNLICELFPKIKSTLTFRTKNNLKSKNLFPNRVNLIADYLSENQMNELCYSSDIFLLPANQVHSVSLTYAMSFGMLLLVSDGWGFEEYCDSSNSINYKNFDEILSVCLDRNKLIEKRISSLEKYKSKYTTQIHKNKVESFLKDNFS